MSVPALAEPAPAVSKPRGVARVRAAIAVLGAAVLGAAPHVLHHVGPLAGAALLAGASGKVLFGALGFALAVPMLRRLRRRTGSWRVPGGVLALMAVMFTFATFVIGPALTGADGGRQSAAPSGTVPSAPPRGSDSEHDTHHP